MNGPENVNHKKFVYNNPLGSYARPRLNAIVPNYPAAHHSLQASSSRIRVEKFSFDNNILLAFVKVESFADGNRNCESALV